MKTTLTFEYDNEQPGIDEEDLAMRVNAWKWKRVVETVAEHLRTRLKYEDLPEPLFTEVTEIREVLTRSMEDDNLTLY
jgi:hypothetical protein